MLQTGRSRVGFQMRSLDFSIDLILQRSRDSVVGIATGYRLDGQRVGVRVQTEIRFFSSPSRPDRFWAHPASYPVGIMGSFPEGKAAGAWS
jgi:hypothetical protein